MLTHPAMRTSRRIAPTLLAALAACLPWTPARAAEQPAAPPASSAARLAKLKEKHGDSMIYEVDDNLKLIFASSTDRATLDEVKQRLTAHARAMQAGLFTTPLTDYVSVILPKEWKGSAQGFYNPGDRSIISKTPGMQLVHEFTHALHYDDMVAHDQFHQNWIIEGLATLCENSRVVDGRMEPRPNYRLKIIKRLVDGNHHVPWATYVTWNQKQFMKAPGNHYSQAQSMMSYLHAKGKLKEWYDAYVAGFAQDATGAAAFEKTFGKPLAEIEKDWVAWVKEQTLPKEAPKPQPAPVNPNSQPARS